MNWRLLKNICVVFLLNFLIISCLQQPIKALPIKDFPPFFVEEIKASEEKDLLKALNHLNEVIEQSPNDPSALSCRGNVRLSLGDAKGAIKDHTSAIALIPDNLESYLKRGEAEEALQMWEAALEDYTFLIERDPEDILVLYHLGNVMGSLGDWTNAELLFAKASSLNKAFVMASSSQALADYQLGYIDKAELELREIIRRYPMFADARAAFTALLWQKGSFGQAKSNWAAVVGLDRRYLSRDWLLKVRRWPSQPANDLFSLLESELS